MATTLGDIASLMRTKNAGPFYLTFDLMFDGQAKYEMASNSNALNAATVAELYGIREQDVEIYHYRPAWAIKVTIPRKEPSCDPKDTDTHGGQQFAPLVDLVL